MTSLTSTTIEGRAIKFCMNLPSYTNGAGHILNSRRLKPHTGQFGGLTPVLARWRMKRAFIKFCMKRPILKDFAVEIVDWQGIFMLTRLLKLSFTLDILRQMEGNGVSSSSLLHDGNFLLLIYLG